MKTLGILLKEAIGSLCWSVFIKVGFPISQAGFEITR